MFHDAVITIGKGKVHVHRGTIVFRDESGHKIDINLASIDGLIIISSGISITSKAVRQILRANVDIVFLRSDGFPAAILTKPIISANAIRTRKQFESTHGGIGLQIASAIVYSKITCMTHHIRYYMRKLSDEILRDTYYMLNDQLNTLVDISSDNMEEHRHRLQKIDRVAEEIYWSGITRVLPEHIHFTGRKIFSRDKFNIGMDYVYGQLVAYILRLLLRQGLDPYMGYVYSLVYGEPMLLYDLVEMFRISCVDYPYIKALRSGFDIEINDQGYIVYSDRVKLMKLFKDNLRRKVFYNGNPTRLGIVIRKIIYDLEKSVMENKVFNEFIDRFKPT